MNKNENTLHGQNTGAGRELGPGYPLADHYELVEPIGQGGMGQVWRARDLAGRRDVAVKLLPPELRWQPEAVEQVRESFQKIHALTHQHIGKTLAMLDDRLAGAFIVMDLIPGQTLSRYAKAYRQPEGGLPVERVAALLRPVALALDYAHLRGVLHRDVKPQNVLVHAGPPLEVTLIDFGIAATIRVSMTRYTNVSPDTAGTRPYMSPEQLRGKKHEWDGRSDQYALAVMAYELLSGDPPFVQDGDDFAFLYAVLNEPVDPLAGLSTHGNAALLKALAKTREQRFGSCVEFIDALSVSVSSPPVVQASASPAPAPPPSAAPTQDSQPVAPAPVRTTKTRLIAPFAANAAAAGQAACAQELGIPVEFSNLIGMKFRLIPPGEFEMGSKENGDEQPIHRVKITKPFYLGVYPVTQGEYERITGTNPSHFKGDARLPVEIVSWEDAVNFAQRLSQQEGNRKYRLPSEAEWEYACRAGTTTAYWFGDALNGDRANVDGNYPFGTDKKGPYRQKTTVVDSFAANPFGLYDMHGNVWEWCRDWYDADYYKRSPIEDPVNETESEYRVLRGGSWLVHARFSRSADRSWNSPTDRDLNGGVRVVCELR